MPEKKASNADKPPAEAPMPTIGKLTSVTSVAPGGATDCGELFLVVLAAFMLSLRSIARVRHTTSYAQKGRPARFLDAHRAIAAIDACGNAVGQSPRLNSLAAIRRYRTW
jgi:hypothetical protein